MFYYSVLHILHTGYNRLYPKSKLIDGLVDWNLANGKFLEFLEVFFTYSPFLSKKQSNNIIKNLLNIITQFKQASNLLPQIKKTIRIFEKLSPHNFLKCFVSNRISNSNFFCEVLLFSIHNRLFYFFLSREDWSYSKIFFI